MIDALLTEFHKELQNEIRELSNGSLDSYSLIWIQTKSSTPKST